MATREELLNQAKEKGLDVTSRTSKADLEKALAKPASEETPERENVQKVEVNPNEDQEAVNGTTKDGQKSPVENTESVPQNGITEVEVLETTDNDVAKEADAARTKEEVQFADESNPNQKARVSAAPGEFDQDGNPRTGGKSYGVADDDLSGGVQENESNPPEEPTEQFTGFARSEASQPGEFLNPEAGSDADTNSQEWSVEDQQKAEKELSEGDIQARIVTSAGSYVKVKWYRNNLPLGSYTTRSFDSGEAKKFLGKLKSERGL